eukprot:3832006-Alexandrium_andersonii.AAC.1
MPRHARPPHTGDGRRRRRVAGGLRRVARGRRRRWRFPRGLRSAARAGPVGLGALPSQQRDLRCNTQMGDGAALPHRV